MNKFAERLTNALRDNHISQAEFAAKIGMSRTIVNNYCTGKREPSLDALITVCNALGESADYMLGITAE
jgi:transcriptional regulator with XRE-family HTH domain